MQLHSLAVTAFGPFADTQHVDFDALADGGLFLFHGPTGAGKTSILDAVCFALYGQVPGARGGSRTLRSDHAAPGARPEVVLEATVRGRRIRLTRSPQWERPKQRGSGTTTEQARVHLQECQRGVWTTLSTRLDETGLQVRRLLGLDVTQFCQVVLLPQGQFAEFLRADADRRRALLESLFDTERFADVERWLVEQRKASSRALDDADQRVGQVVARVAEAAGTEVPHELAPEQTAAWVAELLTVARAGLAGAAAGSETAGSARNAAVAARGEGARLRDLQLRHQQLAGRHEDLLARRAERDAAAAELEAARSVAPVLPLLAEVGRLQTELESVRSHAVAAHRDVVGLLAATGTAGATGAVGSAVRTETRLSGTAAAISPSALRGLASVAGLSGPHLPPPTLVVQASAAARAEIGSLQRLADHEVEADRLVRDMDTLERTIVAIEAQATEVSAWLDAADDRRAVLSHARELAAEAATELPVLREALTVAGSRLDAARRRDDLTLELATARDELRRRTDAAQEKRENWLGVRQARLDGMAAELSAALVPGADCPVCGSIEHPAPAAARPDAVTRQQEDAAGLVASAAEMERSEAQARVGALEVSLAEARVAAGGEAALDVLRADVDTMTRRFETIQAAAATLETAEDAVRAFDEEREGRVRQQVGLDERRKEARVRAVEQQVRLQRLHEVLDDARGDDPSIASRAARLERLAHDCDRLASEVTALERLRGAVDEALSRAELAAAARNLGSLDTVADAARDDERVVELDAFRQRHDAELATVTELLADPEITAAARLATPDMAALDAAAETAERAHAAAVGLLSGAESRVAALDRLHVRLTQLLADREPLAAAHRTIDGLSRLAEGKSADNRLRMSLSGYVLAARLEQVAAAASERLERMSSGRYRLVHTADSASGRGRGGLHLRVLDAWTGADRDPATLSGGESFSASLALALGLADVVTAESGGSLLETLFVDEGFGTLDDDTLDEVMSVLDDLRDGGRVVGLVSHVADLRQRIPVQLVVEKGRGGSTIRQ